MQCSRVVSRVLDGGERPQFQPPLPRWSWERRACKVTPPRTGVLLCSGCRAGGSGCLELLAASGLSPVLRGISLWLPGVRAAVPAKYIRAYTKGMSSTCEQPSAAWTCWAEAKWDRQDGWKCPSGCLVHGCFSCSFSADGGPGFLRLGVRNAAPGAAGE